MRGLSSPSNFSRITYIVHSNIVIGCSRILFLARLSLHGDVTYNAASYMVWDMAQVSTAMILACCPLLRPVFEKMLPARLTRIAAKLKHKNSASIRVTTRIRVDQASSRPQEQGGGFHDGLQEAKGPTFEVHSASVAC